MDKLISKLKRLEEKYELLHGGKIKGSGFVPSNPYAAWNAIRTAREHLGEPLYRYSDVKGFRFCDLGAGLGRAVALAMAEGMWAYGIEENEVLAKQANKHLGKLRNLIGHKGDVKHGSIYTPQFMRLREDDGISPHYENDIEEEIGYAVECEPMIRNLHNFYKNTDIFYAYAWEEQVPSMIELFDLHASTGAVFALNALDFSCIESMADELGLFYEKKEDSQGEFHLLQKIV
jgi:hypothetical protein